MVKSGLGNIRIKGRIVWVYRFQVIIKQISQNPFAKIY